jgi:hypothetical protein
MRSRDGFQIGKSADKICPSSSRKNFLDKGFLLNPAEPMSAADQREAGKTKATRFSARSLAMPEAIKGRRQGATAGH